MFLKSLNWSYFPEVLIFEGRYFKCYYSVSRDSSVYLESRGGKNLESFRLLNDWFLVVYFRRGVLGEKKVF